MTSMTRAEPRTDAPVDLERTVRAAYRLVDVSGREHVPILVETMREVSKATTPAEVQGTFSKTLRRMHGVDGYVATSVRGLAPGTYKVTRRFVKGDFGEGEAPNPWRDWDRIPLAQGGFLAVLMERGEPALVHDMEVFDDPVLGDELAPFRSLLAIPLWDSGSILNWGFYLSRRSDGFGPASLEDLLATTNLVGGTVRNVLANERLRSAEAAQSREIDRIARIQRALLPEPLPSIEGASLAASYATFDRAGGDLYAVRPVRVAGSDETWYLLLIADASGHGPSAAVVSAMVDAVIATHPEPIEGPGALLEVANRYLCAKSVESSFVTAFLGAFEPRSKTLRYARAGHNPPLIRSGGPARRLRLLDEVGDLPLGVDPDSRYLDATTSLHPGETLVLYTDGITEAKNPSGSQFEVERIEEALLHCSGAPTCAVQSITTALLEFEAGVRPADDQTLLVIQVDPAES